MLLIFMYVLLNKSNKFLREGSLEGFNPNNLCLSVQLISFGRQTVLLYSSNTETRSLKFLRIVLPCIETVMLIFNHFCITFNLLISCSAPWKLPTLIILK